MKNLIKIIFVLSFLLPVCVNSQSLTWQRLYNGQSNSYDYGRGVCEGLNGNIFVTGYTFSGNAVILKLNQNGDTIWTKYFDSIKGFFILPTNNGGCIITGRANLVFTLKLDSLGNTIWIKTYTESSQIITTDFIQTKNGGYIISGYKSGVSPVPSYLLKIDSLGNDEWEKYYYGGYIRSFLSVAESKIGGYILTGTNIDCETCSGYPQILEITSEGNILWERNYELFADFEKIYLLNDEYLIGGTILDSPYVNSNAFIMKTNLSGDIIFKKNVKYGNREVLKDLVILNEDKYVIACETDTLNQRSAGIYILDLLGNIIHRNLFYVSDYSIIYSIFPLRNNDLIFCGTVHSNLPQGSDIYVVRSDSTLNVKPLFVRNKVDISKKDYLLFQNYPNPFNPTTIIKFKINPTKKSSYEIKISNLLGEIIESYEIKGNPVGEIHFNATNISSGMYFYSLFKDNLIIETKKMFYIK